MFNSLSKEDKLKYGVLALISLFILSTIAQFAGTALGSHNQQTSQDPSTPPSFFKGAVKSTATFISYDPSIEITNMTGELDNYTKKLKEEGVLSYIVNQSNIYVLRLSSSSSVLNVSENIQLLGLTPYVAARLSLNELNVTTEAGPSYIIQGETLPIKIVPVFNIGDKVNVSFSATIKNGRLYTYSPLVFESSGEVDFSVSPLKVEQNKITYQIYLNWEDRLLNISKLKEKLSDAKILYSENSYIKLDPPLTESQATSLSLSKPDYITSIQLNRIEINPSFNNRALIETDFQKLGVIAEFDPPTLSINFNDNNTNSLSSILKIQTAWKELYPNTQGSLVTLYHLNITLNKSLQYNSKSFLLKNNNFILKSLSKPSDNATVNFTASPTGRVITSFSKIQYISNNKESSYISLLDDTINQFTINLNQTNSTNSNNTDENTSVKIGDGVFNWPNSSIKLTDGE